MRVLVVEDEPAMADSLAWGLRAEGYVVDIAYNGPDGLWKAKETDHDVIILDVMLPGLDGYQVCRKLREQGRWTPILMLTAMDEDLDHAEGLDSGADDYLAKPFSYAVLLAHLRALTRRGLGARPAVLTAAGLTLDPASRVVSHGGLVLDLTSREVSVLEHLMRRQGQVVSKTELLDHCWDPAYDGGPAAVEVHMHRLRRKIEPVAGNPVIRTLRGEGYLIPADVSGPDNPADERSGSPADEFPDDDG
ncbi:response regulator transcription factor [Frankia sp. AgB1.9]|uniref:response regulator transcription factor n=1 Tax=unclassified Frankia TaxID=2632575 RepID=UPI001933806B|nr:MULTISPECIES: response regulator transcription factor [unclassified Frankia]MBL7490531.1 response regulator transcription factor [Frankia sp. AgW1.1]MBL7551000.1 response regulator transcription factor [Frankia sp. AgB1.9]MBL7621219.1 response regulator transcription factor [Frankia sp. AgB1.8]